MLTQLPLQAQNQKHANIRYFGDRAGLDFNSGTPVTLTNSSMNAFEGTASRADDQGRLVFHSDGTTEAELIVTKPDLYKLRAYNQHCEATDGIRVKFKNCVGGLFIPNIITSNGNGLIEVFFIHGLTEDDWELRIFNS
ncbi:hypothetical protein ABID22_000242 [Pontibacter aydingkolensis]|uniref:Uncharacterized protein n=1 Tax=Pontibacter aydingkolensis TaxID=1911536 RepID=A0ABS7CQH4_9BACT|nr:hypothetical protein [Pontibacter aydingkolensis]MBW7466091.1 hypothetical protein [Pontibacter aydingkolensis]